MIDPALFAAVAAARRDWREKDDAACAAQARAAEARQELDRVDAKLYEAYCAEIEAAA